MIADLLSTLKKHCHGLPRVSRRIGRLHKLLRYLYKDLQAVQEA